MQKRTVTNILLILLVTLLLIGCGTETTTAQAAEETPPELPVLASPPPRDTPKPEATEEPNIKTFNLDWQPIEASLYREQIAGTIGLFYPQEFMIFIPDFFVHVWDVTLATVPEGNELIAIYQTEKKDYTLTMSHGVLPNEFTTLTELAESLINDADKTVCNAIINGIPCLDIEDYIENTLQIIVPSVYLSKDALSDDYVTFLFSPITATDYTDITISMIASILPLFPDTIHVDD